MLWKRRSLRIIRSMISEGGITVKPGQDSIHELIIWKVNPFVASVTCSRYQIAFKWSVNFWLQLLSIRWDGKYFYLNILQIQENWADRNFITHNELACVLTAHLYATSKSADWNQQQLTDGGILANRNSENHPIQSEKSPDSGFLHVICKRNVSCPLPEIQGEGMIAG